MLFILTWSTFLADLHVCCDNIVVLHLALPFARSIKPAAYYSSFLIRAVLMVKWIWRLFTHNPENTLWHCIIRAKYPGAGDIFSTTPHGGSPFWRSLHKIKDFFKLEARFSLGNGQRIRFWTDCWLNNEPLSVRFERMFEISTDPDCLVAQVHQDSL
jgi:hypothetical protein